MSDWHAFNASNKPGTCLWCGRKLRRTTVMAEAGEPGARKVGKGTGAIWLKPAEKLGSYRDDHFCGLRCGYQFGVRAAGLGDRFAVRAGGVR